MRTMISLPARRLTRVRSVTHSADIPFSRDDARNILPGMIACLIGFISLLLSFSISLSLKVSDASRAANASFQIEMPAAITKDKKQLATLTNIIKRHPAIESTQVIDHAKMQTLLQPWLGDNILLGTLQVPVLIDVIINPELPFDKNALTTQLQEIDKRISIASKGPWQQDVANAAQTMHAFLLGLAVLLIGCVIAMVMLLAKTGLRLHFRTVSLLHLFGATDDYILRQFQHNSAWLVARGAIVGVCLSIIGFLVLIEALNGNSTTILPQLEIELSHVVLWILLPVFVAFMAMIATRFSVQRMLSTMH